MTIMGHGNYDAHIAGKSKNTFLSQKLIGIFLAGQLHFWKQNNDYQPN
jgi:hypothetical protein